MLNTRRRLMSELAHFGLFTSQCSQATGLTFHRVVFVVMLISSIAFYIMAFRVPVVSSYYHRI